MIASPHPKPTPLTPEEYLAWEAKQEIRHEYIDGEILAMTGSSIPHNDLVINLLGVLLPHIKNRGCRLNMSDVKVQAKRGDRYFYPDLVISCHPQDLKATQWIQYPKVIIEVLSPSTANYDRSRKLRYYRKIPSLQEYLLINTDQILVEVYQRQTANLWVYCDYGSDEIFHIPSLEFECFVNEIYGNINLEILAEDSDINKDL
jgi:Uma2 family endonuclease